MKVIIAGSRTITSYAEVVSAIYESGWRSEITEVVCGGARGADSLGRRWANAKGIPVAHFLANFKELGPKAGPLRNMAMAKYADALILIWDGSSRGSLSMLKAARAHNLPIHEHIVRKDE